MRHDNGRSQGREISAHAWNSLVDLEIAWEPAICRLTMRLCRNWRVTAWWPQWQSTWGKASDWFPHPSCRRKPFWVGDKRSRVPSASIDRPAQWQTISQRHHPSQWASSILRGCPFSTIRLSFHSRGMYPRRKQAFNTAVNPPTAAKGTLHESLLTHTDTSLTHSGSSSRPPPLYEHNYGCSSSRRYYNVIDFELCSDFRCMYTKK